MPLVSIIMNCYNGEKYLSRALESIINQKYSNWELIFWDNLSIDQSKKIFLQYKDQRFRYYKSEKFMTLYEARNEALNKCKGKYITFLDIDDYWFEKKLVKQVEFLEKNEEVGLVYSNYIIHNINKFFFKKNSINPKLFKSGRIINHLIKKYYIGLLTVMIRRSFMKDDLKNFDSKYNLLSDFDYILRFSKIYEIDYIKDVLAIYYQHQDQLQLQNISNQADQLNDWFKNKVIKNKIFGNNHDFSSIEKKIYFLNSLKSLKNKNFFINIKDLIFYPNNIYKIKFFLILFFPKKFYQKIFSLT